MQFYLIYFVSYQMKSKILLSLLFNLLLLINNIIYIYYCKSDNYVPNILYKKYYSLVYN